jgi:TrmH family RNA methyltransferase
LGPVTVVLVEPMYGGNVGSVARAMANFGLDRLVLVNPAPGILESPELAPMARSALELVRDARVAPNLAEALSDAELALGFTTRLGKQRRDGVELRPGVEQIAREHSGLRIAAVFGREDRGLTTGELNLCHWLVRIPTDPRLPSLNLAQAVALFAYEWSEARRADLGGPSVRGTATVAELEGLYAHLEAVLTTIGFIEERSPARMMNHVRRIFSRRLPDARDVRILRGILSKVEGKTRAAEASAP